MSKQYHTEKKATTQGAKISYERAGFVREDKYVLKYVPQEPSYGRGGKNNQRGRPLNDYEEEEKSSYTNYNDHQPNRQWQNKQQYGNIQSRYQEETMNDDYPYSTTASESKGQNRRGGYQHHQQQPAMGRARGQNSHQDEGYEQEGLVYHRARFADRGRGRGRGANQHQTQGRDNGFGQPVDFQETRTRTRGRGRGRGRGHMAPIRDYTNQWVKDDNTYDDQHHHEEEHDSEIFHQSSSSVANDEIFQPKYFLNDQRNIEELFEEKCIHDKRSMQQINEYQPKTQAYPKPEFYQGPQYVVYKQLTSQNRKQRIQSSELFDIQFQNKEKFEQEQQRSHYNANARFEKEREKPQQKFKEVYGQTFDFKHEKRTENKFWDNPEGYSKKSRPQKEEKVAGAPARFNRQKGRKGSGGKKGNQKSEASKDKFFKKSDGKRGYGDKHQAYEEHLNEEQIQEGIKQGFLFEGILRVNQNNRKRAFVHVNDIKFDVMVDGLIQQNRGLDGDTVIVQLLEPTRWQKYVSNNVVVGKDSMGSSKLISTISTTKNRMGYTNETAIETRIIDLETIEQLSPQAQVEEELKEIQEELKQQQRKESSASSDSSDSSSSKLSHSSEEKQLKKETVESKLDKQDDLEEEEDVGYGMLEDEEVSSESSEEEAKTPKDKKLQMIKEESSRSAKVERKQKEIVKQRDGHKKQQGNYQSIFKGKSRAEILIEVNRIAQDLRPMGIIKAIISSPSREKEHLVTLIKVESSMEFDEKALQNLISLHDQKKNAVSTGIFAVPVSKKLPWMALFNIPIELIQDIKSKKKINQRYYIVKMMPGRHMPLDQHVM